MNTSGDMLPSAEALREYREAWVELEKNGQNVLAFASSDATLARNSLMNILDSLDSMGKYEKMSKARGYTETVSLVTRLANWRGDLWSRGFEIVHPHKTVEQAYRRFADKFKIPLAIPELFRDLSIVNNSAIIWAKETPQSQNIAYFKVYKPESTRIQIVKKIFWVKPSDDFRNEVKAASQSDLDNYTQDNRHAKKWVNAIKDMTSGVYAGYVPLQEKDGEFHELILGSGGSSDQSYDTVSMQSIFHDLELLKMLIEGDWETAFLLKNMIMVVKVGESITGGPLQGSRVNWAKQKDVDNLKTQIQKTGKAHILYGNHTLQIEFKHPEPSVFSPEKYDAVINRVCMFYGIGLYMLVGAATGQSRGASYAAASWNVQAIRTEARAKREIVTEHFKSIFSHPSIIAAAFKGQRDIYWHDCFSKIDGKSLKFVDVDFSELSERTIGNIEYSRDGFATFKEVAVRHVYSDISSIVLERMPSNAEPSHFRLHLTPSLILDLLGPPTLVFDERGMKDDRQNLQEVQFASQQGMLSVLTSLRELGFRFDTEVAQKMREKEIQEILWPVFEKNQGLVQLLFERAIEDGMKMIDEKEGKAPGEPGRPDTQPEGQQDTSQHPRPSTASLDENDFASMTDEELAELKIAVWSSMDDVPERLKTLHGARLTLDQINGMARQAEGAERGGAENGWAVARAHFQKTHHIEGGRWVKNQG